MTIMESIRNFMLKCPCIEDFELGLGVESLGEDEGSYSINTTPCNPIVKKYNDGSSVRQFDFVFASKNYFGPDVMENIQNCGFYEKFSEWLEDSTRSNDLPAMGDGKTARKLIASTTGYVFNADETSAQYQIQCKLIYFEEKR